MVGLKIADTNSYAYGIEFRDTLLIALMLNHKYTFLPEIYKAFGKEGMLKFIDIFGGAVIKVPSHEDLMRTVRDVQIFLDIKHKRKTGLSFSKIAHRYDIPQTTSIDIYNRLKKQIESLDGLAIDELFRGEDLNDDGSEDFRDEGAS